MKKVEEPNLTLYNKRIQVRESTPYLGLVIDKRLNWRNHIEHLRARCIPAVNLLKHLSHLSWGADRQTLLHLYTALVKSKINYGAQVYGIPETKILNRLNPIQNECLRACTGAFKSSPAASLCVEAGVPPLKYARDIVTLEYFFKSSALQNSPTYETIVGTPGTEVQSVFLRGANLSCQAVRLLKTTHLMGKIEFGRPLSPTLGVKLFSAIYRY